MLFDTERYKYDRNGVKTPGGRAAVDNGDELAQALRGRTIEQIFDDVLANDEKVQDRWHNLNNGMKRMVASNVLRGVMRRKGSVVVDGTTICKA